MPITNQTVNNIFKSLEQYRTFCRDFGYKFNEQDLFNYKSFSFKQYQRFIQGKDAKNQWEADLTRFKGVKTFS